MRCNFTQENFLHFANQTLISETVHAAPSQKCISDWDLGLARKIHSDIARTHSPILQWDVNSKSPKHGLDFWLQSLFLLHVVAIQEQGTWRPTTCVLLQVTRCFHYKTLFCCGSELLLILGIVKAWLVPAPSV